MSRFLIVLISAVICTPALAGPTCTKEPKDKWLSESAMKEKIAALGYTFQVFKVTAGNCYEIYGRDKSGQRVEIYFHPITGDKFEEFKS